MAFYRAPTEFLLAILCALTTPSLRFYGAHDECVALSWRSCCADGVLKTFVCATGRALLEVIEVTRRILISQLRHEAMKVTMLKPSSFLQPWPDPKHSRPLGPPPSSSSKNDVNSVCSILELLDLHIGKKESSFWRTSDMVKGRLICISRFYGILYAFVIIVCISHFSIYFVCFCDINADGRGKTPRTASYSRCKNS